MSAFSGIAHVYGDNIDTDRIIPGKYTKTLDVAELARHALEDLDPAFAQRVRPGDVLIAGVNFGSGSSREQAPIALKAAGIRLVAARSFARIFFRNAINIGLTVVEIGDHPVVSGDKVTVSLAEGLMTHEASRTRIAITRIPAALQRILDAGGLVPYLREHGQYPEELG